MAKDLERIEIRMWRMCDGAGQGVMMWFDPLQEEPRLFRIEPPDPEEGSGVHAFSEEDDQSRLHPKKSAQLILFE